MNGLPFKLSHNSIHALMTRASPHPLSFISFSNPLIDKVIQIARQGSRQRKDILGISWHLSRFSITAAHLDFNILPNTPCDVEMLSRSTSNRNRFLVSSAIPIYCRWERRVSKDGWDVVLTYPIGYPTIIPWCNAVTYCNCQNNAHEFGCFINCHGFVETSLLQERRVEVPQKIAMPVDCTTQCTLFAPCSWFNTTVAMHPYT